MAWLAKCCGSFKDWAMIMYKHMQNTKCTKGQIKEMIEISRAIILVPNMKTLKGHLLQNTKLLTILPFGLPSLHIPNHAQGTLFALGEALPHELRFGLTGSY